MIEAWKERGQAVPASFQAEVDATDEADDGIDFQALSYLEQHFVSLYSEASTCRPASMGGVSPIPVTAIHQLLRDHGIDGEEARTAIIMIRVLDHAAIEHANAKKDA